MKNTIKSGNFRVLIYHSNEGYVGICYETGFVDVGETLEEVQEHIFNGMIAILKTIEQGKLSEEAINQSPAFKYRVLFFVLPIVSAFSRWLEVSFFTKPIHASLLVNT